MMTVIVSRGAGTWGPRMRLWDSGEIVRVTLRVKMKEGEENTNSIEPLFLMCSNTIP